MAFTYTTRKDGRLMKKVSINGKPKYLYSDNAKDLEKQYIELKHMLYLGVDAIRDNVKFSDFALKWKEINSTGKQFGTIEEYDFLLNSHLLPAFGKMKIKDIKVYHIKQLLKDMEHIPPTAKKALQLMKRILNDAVDNDIVIKNVAQNIKSPKITKKEKKPLTLEEDRILLKHIHKYSSFFVLMRYTGMRREEIVPLTTNDIDLKNKTISINKAVTFIHNQPILKTTKNEDERTLPVLNIVYEIVENLVENANKDGLLFFKETDKKMLTESAINRHLESFLYSININETKKISFTCHRLRHSFCTMLYYAGVGIKEAQELMGHKSAQMVYDIYTHLDKERENANKLINDYIEQLQKLSESCQN